MRAPDRSVDIFRIKVTACLGPVPHFRPRGLPRNGPPRVSSCQQPLCTPAIVELRTADSTPLHDAECLIRVLTD
jgi:hypothetical protein